MAHDFSFSGHFQKLGNLGVRGTTKPMDFQAHTTLFECEIRMVHTTTPKASVVKKKRVGELQCGWEVAL